MFIKNKDTNKKFVGKMKINEYDINQDFSAALIEINGEHGKIKSLNEDRIYFIISGSGRFEVGDIIEDVQVNDLVFVPKNTVYNIIGEMKYLFICSPEFNPKNDVFVKK